MVFSPHACSFISGFHAWNGGGGPKASLRRRRLFRILAVSIWRKDRMCRWDMDISYGYTVHLNAKGPVMIAEEDTEQIKANGAEVVWSNRNPYITRGRPIPWIHFRSPAFIIFLKNQAACRRETVLLFWEERGRICTPSVGGLRPAGESAPQMFRIRK